MKSFLIAATIALTGTGMMSGDASARSARMNQAGMGAMMAMAPGMIEAGTALIGSGALGGPIATPHGLVGAPSIAPIVVPHPVPVALPVVLPGLPSIVTLPAGSVD
ncbi:MAG: hypothetical protein R3D69_07240 [Xanthobacteraceae bacterium]